MARKRLSAAFLNRIVCSPNGEQEAGRPVNRAIWRTFQALPLRDRSILRLVYERGATQRELAGAMGVTRDKVRGILRKALKRATDPVLADLIAAWATLPPEERRLVYLHRILGVTIRDIARFGLAKDPADRGQPKRRQSEWVLGSRLRKIERRIRRPVPPAATGGPQAPSAG
jgi:predicted DNA-binding protein (UPF0251 family)